MCIVVGNLAPQESLRTEFILTAPLISEDCFWKLLIPVGFIPVDRSNVVEFVFAVDITTNSAITSYSSNYPLVWESNGLIVAGRLNIQNQFTAEDSIWVKYQAINTNVPTCIIQKLENKFAAMMSFIPFAPDVSLNDAEGTGEFIFVLDRSGSMSGNSIELAKKAAILFLQSLPNGSYFNIVSFGSTFTRMYSSSQQNTSKITSKTIHQLENFQADMEGTNILEPLMSIFSESPCLDPPVNKLSKYFFGAGSSHECARSIFLLTDGQVSNNNEVIKLIKENARNSRVYGFGIGNQVDTGLITDSAKAGKGRAYFASNVETLGRLVISALQHSILPCVNSWEINWTGECYPPTAKIGNVYYGERCVQYILLDTLPMVHPIIKWYDNFTKNVNQLTISTFQVLEGDQIFKLWAKHKIELLSESNQTKGEVIQLSKEFQIPSPLTSFICVKQYSEAVVGDMQSIKIPVAFINKSSAHKSGWRSSRMLISHFSPNSNLARKRSGGGMERIKDEVRHISEEFYMQSTLIGINRKEEDIMGITQGLCMKSDSIEGLSEKICDLSSSSKSFSKSAKKSSWSVKESQPAPARSIYMSIITAQDSQGFWSIKQISDTVPAIKNIPAAVASSFKNENILCTICILCYLQKYMQDCHDEWILIEKKAVKWLKAQGLDIVELKGRVFEFI